VRYFAETVKPLQGAVYYQVLPDEVWDMSLVSQRVYGRRDEFLAVLAAAGLGGFDEALPMKVLVLPNPAQLDQLKRRTGFESIAEFREDGKPVWVN
jgi:hypothetical protein